MNESQKLIEVNVAHLQPHPDNPRILIREDVIAAIAANLNGEFPQKHALHVRPLNDGYQVLSGHHRLEAAKRKGLTTVWCWSEDIDDDAAFMELATSNSQGELSPLEIGIHALRAVPPEKGGRGKKGGLSAYAEKIGKGQSYVVELRQAAEVLAASKAIAQAIAFLDKAKHLAAIHRLPKECWPAACSWLANSGKSESVAVIEEHVATSLEYFNNGRDTEHLPLLECTGEVFCQPSMSNTFQRLADIAERVILELREDPELLAQWQAWLIQSRPDSWDIKAVQAKRIELEQVLWERQNAEAVESDEIPVLMADPPWQYDFSETSNRQIENQYPSASVEEICSHVNAPWFPKVADVSVLFLWATAPKLLEAIRVMEEWGFTYKTHAVWDKEKIGMGYWFRGQHELLLVGTRGDASPPEESARVSSVFRETRGGHSVKPQCVYAAIEKAFPEQLKGEIYARTERPGWKAYRIGGSNHA